METPTNNETRKRKFIETQEKIDFEDPDTSHDRILVVEDEKFYVISPIVSLSSEHFRVMFNSNFAKANRQEVVLEDVSDSAFTCYLKLIYPPYLSDPVHVILRDATSSSVILELLSLSFRFLCPAVYSAVLQHIKHEFGKTGLQKFNLVKVIELAILHDLDEFKEMVFKSLGCVKYAAEKSEQLSNAPSHVKTFVLMAYMSGKIQPNRARDESSVGLTTVSTFGGPPLPRNIARLPRNRGGF